MSELTRRRFLAALGLGTGAVALGGIVPRAGAGPIAPIRRVVFVLTAHAHVWNHWHMPIPGVPDGAAGTRPLADLSIGDLSESLRPLYAHRSRILPIEGIAHASVLGEFVRHAGRTDVDLNNHNLSMAHLLSPRTAMQRGAGVTCVAGGRSIDQELGARISEPGLLRTPVWGADHYLPYSYVDAGVAAPRVEQPEQIYADLLGLWVPPPPSAPSRVELVDHARTSVLDVARRELDAIIPRYGREAARKLSIHRDLVRDLELSLAARRESACDPVWAPTGHTIAQYFDLASIALACDLARVITIVPDVLRAAEFGYPAEADVHGNYAHSSVDDRGEPFNPVSERAMVDYNVFYAQRVAAFLDRLSAIPDGDGTLLDHTAVVWLTELGSPTHQHKDACALVAGGSDFFRLGRYQRYARTIPSPSPWFSVVGGENVGPAQNRLFVTLMRYMGHADESFGDTTAPSREGEISLTGTLRELHV